MNIRKIVGLSAFVSSVIIGFIAIFMPPQGEIDNSVLWFTGQLLVFTASLLGVDLNIGHFSTKKDKNEDK